MTIDSIIDGQQRQCVIRADASASIGNGHIIRCLALAQRLRAGGISVLFIARAHPGHLADLIAACGFKCRLLPTPADLTERSETEATAGWLSVPWRRDAVETAASLEKDLRAEWLIVDHYGLDRQWETHMRPHARKILVIDDLANRPHDCDVLLDQTPGRRPDDYGGLVSPGSCVLAGADYALLRPEFATKRNSSLKRRDSGGPAARILVAMGGTDPENLTTTILDALEYSRHPLPTSVVMSSRSRHLAMVRERAAAVTAPVTVLTDVADMADLMSGADIAVGACGTTALERCALGLPAITIVTAENQKLVDKNLTAAGAVVSLGWFANVTASDIARGIDGLIEDGEKRARISAAARSICDGSGANRLVTQLFEQVGVCTP